MAGRPRRAFNPHTSTPAADSGGLRVPEICTDPVWSLRPWPVQIIVAGRELEIPAQPAADWLAVLMRDSFSTDDMFRSLSPGITDALDEALYSGALPFEEYSAMALDVISAAAGRPWYIAIRLVATAQQSWGVIGAELLRRGINAAVVSLSGWLDVALLIMLQSMDKKDVTMFTTKLTAPPPGADPMEMEMSADDFQALMDGQ